MNLLDDCACARRYFYNCVCNCVGYDRITRQSVELKCKCWYEWQTRFNEFNKRVKNNDTVDVKNKIKSLPYNYYCYCECECAICNTCKCIGTLDCICLRDNKMDCGCDGFNNSKFFYCYACNEHGCIECICKFSRKCTCKCFDILNNTNKICKCLAKEKSIV